MVFQNRVTIRVITSLKCPRVKNLTDKTAQRLYYKSESETESETESESESESESETETETETETKSLV